MAQWTKNVGSTITTAVFFDEPGNACWFATQDGRIGVFRILGQIVRALGDGWTDAVAVLPSVDGLNVFVVMSSGQILIASRTHADRSQASVVASGKKSILSAARLANDDILVLDDSGRVRRLTPRSGAFDTVASVQGATGLAMNEATGELLVAISGATSRIRRFKLANGSSAGKTVNIAGPVAAFAPSPAAAGVLICDNAGTISSRGWSGSTDPFTFQRPGITSLCCWHSLVIAAAGSSLELVEWGEDVETLGVTAGLDPLTPSGWAPFLVDYAGAGITAEDVEWRVDEGPAAATLSVARPFNASNAAYEHRVIAGWGTPEFHITAHQRSTSKTLATRRFRVVRVWPDTEVGPPMATTGWQQVYAKGVGAEVRRGRRTSTSIPLRRSSA